MLTDTSEKVSFGLERKQRAVYILGIETSCDETSLAVVKNGTEVITEKIASQVKIMSKYGGVVPELSARQHLTSLPILFNLCFKTKKNLLHKISAIAVTKEPGLPPTLSVGISYAKGLAFAYRIPLIEVNHLQAHICSVFIKDPPPKPTPYYWADKITFPHISLVVSGGHTSLFLVVSPIDTKLIAQTIDDAAGESYDKVARLLGLRYPGGPTIEKEAKNFYKVSQEKRVFKSNPFTLPIPNDYSHFSFSGLKTAVRNIILKLGDKYGIRDASTPEEIGKKLPPSVRAEIAYWFQETVVESLVQKSINACIKHKVKLITITGGVSANKRLQEQMGEYAQYEGVKIRFPPLKHCTDNGSMVACAGFYKFVNEKLA
jgi:N6-L-threonylcarbamoyladenine synthase